MHILGEMQKRKQKRASSTAGRDAFALGAVFAGALGALGYALANSRERLVVGGVDLSTVDLSQPFWVNFSVEQNAAVVLKRQAHQRLHAAMHEFHRAFPAWVLDTNVDVHGGVFLLLVQPATSVAQGIVRSLATS